MKTNVNAFRHGYASGDISIFLWLYVPITFIVIQFIAAGFLEPGVYRTIIATELGFIENLSVLFALVAIFTGCRIWIVRSNFPSVKYNIYIIIFIFGCIYILLEEISWGQHYLQWETPGWLSEINKQNETNLHNIHGYIGLVPKAILEWTIYITGIILTLKFRKNNTTFNHRTDWKFWALPTIIILPSAVFAFWFRVIDRMENWFDLDHMIDWDETHECLLTYVILLYLLSLHKRLKQVQSGQISSAGEPLY